ncbi:MAG: hypothetical protein NMNS01_24880 [Nitrosomonas sp.]|nr:MAG: hypothetical protein NMNS01_24880 [Nitrosomonas sp.]
METIANQILAIEEKSLLQDLINRSLFEQIIHSNPHLEPKDALQNFLDLLKKKTQSSDENSTPSALVVLNGLRPIPPPIEQVSRTHIPTDAAAHYLNRKPQTLRAWACLENGPVRPIRINGRLAWPVAEIKKVLGLGE